MKKAGVILPTDSIVENHDGEMEEEVMEGGGKPDQGNQVTGEMECNGKAEEGNQGKRRLRASFGVRRTHNEQLIMRPCGVILARATFYGSEAVSAVNVCI